MKVRDLSERPLLLWTPPPPGVNSFQQIPNWIHSQLPQACPNLTSPSQKSTLRIPNWTLPLIFENSASRMLDHATHLRDGTKM